MADPQIDPRPYRTPETYPERGSQRLRDMTPLRGRALVEVEPEAALRGANAKFERRFSHIERRLAERGRRPEGASLDQMEALWQEAKALERRER